MQVLVSAQSTEWKGGSKHDADVEDHPPPIKPYTAADLEDPPEVVPSHFDEPQVRPENLTRPAVPRATLISNPWREAGVYKQLTYGEHIAPDTQRMARNVGVRGKCIVWGFPAAIRTYDGRGFSFQGSGEFVFHTDKKNKEQVSIVQARQGQLAYNTGVGFRSFGEVFTAFVKVVTEGNTTTNQVQFKWNDQDITRYVLGESQIHAGRFYITHEGRFDDPTTQPFVMTVNSPNASHVIMSFQRSNGIVHINAFIEVPSRRFDKTDGVCGLWDLDATNDLRNPTGGILSDAAAVATAWRVDPSLALFPTYQGDSTLVLSTPITPTALGKSQEEVNNATTLCAPIGPDFRVACTFNVLANGPQAMKEALVTEHLAEENGLLVDPQSSKCLPQSSSDKIALGPWTQFSKCNNKCGEGVKYRHRSIYRIVNGTAEETVCGNLTEVKSCWSTCDKVSLFGKCVHFGAVSTFDGNVYHTPARGEFMLYRNTDIKEQINVIQRLPRNTTVPIVVGAAFRLGPDVFELYLARPKFDELAFRYNGQDIVALTAEKRHVFGMFHVRRVGTIRPEHNTKLIFEVKAAGGTTMTVSLDSMAMAKNASRIVDRMVVFVEAGGNMIGKTGGLCSSFDFQSKNDFLSRSGKPLLPARFGWSWRVKKDVDSLFHGVTPLRNKKPASFKPITARNVSGLHKRDVPMAVETCKFAVRIKKFRPACVLDVLTYGASGVRPSVAASAVTDDSVLETDSPKAVQCLAQPGSTLGPWSWWTACSTDCGPGRKIRSRNVLSVDGTVCGDLVQTSVCMKTRCPIDCKLSPWSDFGACSTDCGQGVKSRTRQILVQPKYHGKPCDPVIESTVCLARNGCCEVGPWSKWTKCVKGIQKRYRSVSPKPSCGAKVDRRACCDYGKWSKWSECDNGEQTRTRPVFGAATCTAFKEKRSCCYYSKWSRWTKCTKGRQTRHRKVRGPASCGPIKQEQQCCSVSRWFKWSKCDPVTRTRFRLRTVSGPRKCAPKIQRGPCPAWELALMFPNDNRLPDASVIGMQYRVPKRPSQPRRIKVSRKPLGQPGRPPRLPKVRHAKKNKNKKNRTRRSRGSKLRHPKKKNKKNKKNRMRRSRGSARRRSL